MPKVLVISTAAAPGRDPGSAGKRRLAAPLVSTSDEDEDDCPLSPSSCSDYENVTSPSSSTASGPTYVRTPAFTQHAHSVISRPKIKKKRTILTEITFTPATTNNNGVKPVLATLPSANINNGTLNGTLNSAISNATSVAGIAKPQSLIHHH